MARRTKEGFWERFSRTGVILILLYVMFIILGFAVRLLFFADRQTTSIVPNQNIVSAEGTATATTSLESTALSAESDPVSTDGTPVDQADSTIVGLEMAQSFVAVLEGGTTSVSVNMSTTGQASANDLSWSSSDPSVAMVDSAGTITGVQAGTCEITVSAKGDDSVSASVPVTVRRLEVIDGCTYVDGILIVNKSYGLPADYNPGLEDYVLDAFHVMQAAAAEEGLDLYIGSDFRDYEYQVTIYGNYSQLYGWEMADTFSARPGHSEHQTGLTIDCNSIDDSFGETPESEWLAQHCAEYGFIIRFPEGKEDITGYQYEPWHIRYLGRELATEINDLGITLEEYLGVDSVYAGPWEGAAESE